MSRLLIPLALLLGGCAGFDDTVSRQIVDEVIASNIGSLAWSAGWRSFVFGVIGLGLGLGLFFGLRARELFRLDWQHAKWVRAATGVLFAAAFVFVGSWWGFWQGVVHGSRDMIEHGSLGSEGLPIVGDAGSMMIASIYVASEQLDEQPSLDDAQLTRLEQRVAAYTKGEWAMDTAELDARLARARAQTVGIASDLALREIHARYPELEGSLADELLPWALDKLGAKLSEKVVESAVQNETSAMIAEPLQDVFAGLDDAAAREGDDANLSHTELRAHIVEVGLIPMLNGPIEHVARGQQNTAWIGLALFVLVALGGFRLADHLIARRKNAAPSV